MADEPRIVAAVGNFAAAGRLGGPSRLVEDLEKAARIAVLKAMEAGVPLDDSEIILRYKAEARAAVLKDYGLA